MVLLHFQNDPPPPPTHPRPPLRLGGAELLHKQCYRRIQLCCAMRRETVSTVDSAVSVCVLCSHQGPCWKSGTNSERHSTDCAPEPFSTCVYSSQKLYWRWNVSMKQVIINICKLCNWMSLIRQRDVIALIKILPINCNVTNDETGTHGNKSIWQKQIT